MTASERHYKKGKLNNMKKKKNNSKNKHAVKEDKQTHVLDKKLETSVEMVETMSNKKDVANEPEATVIAFDKLREPSNPNPLFDKAFADAVRTMLADRQRYADSNKNVSQLIALKFKESMIGLDDIPHQVSAVNDRVVNLNDVSGVINALNDYTNSMAYKNPETGFRQPLDQRIVKITGQMAEEVKDLVLPRKVI